MVALLAEKSLMILCYWVWIQLPLALGKNITELKNFWSVMAELLVEKSPNDPMFPGLNPATAGIG